MKACNRTGNGDVFIPVYMDPTQSEKVSCFIRGIVLKFRQCLHLSLTVVFQKTLFRCPSGVKKNE